MPPTESGASSGAACLRWVARPGATIRRPADGASFAKTRMRTSSTSLSLPLALSPAPASASPFALDLPTFAADRGPPMGAATNWTRPRPPSTGSPPIEGPRWALQPSGRALARHPLAR
ncbi:unnamed protein product [Prorocentrum cordatum]|uniref:Uncharacterized protein n=1 Tax=Prorocentrum cordatum TaxID=2364126 RepID=A0ABN9W483_9DINO|nr:unnamed protein product [Polarella glacialis]